MRVNEEFEEENRDQKALQKLQEQVNSIIDEECKQQAAALKREAEKPKQRATKNVKGVIKEEDFIEP